MSSVEFTRTGSKGAIGPFVRLAPSLAVLVDGEEVAEIANHGDSAVIEVTPGNHSAQVGWKGIVGRIAPGPPYSEPYAFEVAADERLSLSCGIQKYRFGRAAAGQAAVLQKWAK